MDTLTFACHHPAAGADSGINLYATILIVG
jgi:hypothetical protein